MNYTNVFLFIVSLSNVTIFCCLEQTSSSANDVSTKGKHIVKCKDNALHTPLIHTPSHTKQLLTNLDKVIYKQDVNLLSLLLHYNALDPNTYIHNKRLITYAITLREKWIKRAYCQNELIIEYEYETNEEFINVLIHYNANTNFWYKGISFDQILTGEIAGFHVRYRENDIEKHYT